MKPLVHVLRPLTKSVSGHRLLVFTFHNLLEAGDTDFVGLPRDLFERQVRWIVRHFDVLGLVDGVSRANAGTLARPSACITFDDGYRAQMSIGAALLEELGVTASFFVTTGHLGDRTLWNDWLRLFHVHASSSRRAEFLEALSACSSTAEAEGSPTTSADDIERWFKYLPISRRASLLELVRAAVPSNCIDRRMLDETDLRALHRRGFEIGGHTASHPILKLESAQEARQQIGDDLERLQEILGERVRCFAFPNGMPGTDFDTRELDILANLGVEIALTSALGHVAGGTDPLQVPRVALHGHASLGYLRTVASACRARGIELPREGQRPSLHFVSYHFSPSPEVGAKRPTATALHLAQRFDVSVVRSVDRIQGEVEANAETTFRSIVDVPRTTSSLVAGRPDSALSPSHASPWLRRLTAASLRWGGGAVAVDIFRSIDGSLQQKKRWLLRGARLSLPLLRTERPRVVVASGPPMASLVLGALIARFSRAKLVLDFRDPWYVYGEVEYDELVWGKAIRPIALLERALLAWCLAGADTVVVASPGIRRHLLSLKLLREGTPLHVVRNGFEPDALVREPMPTGRLEMLYAGSLYWNRDPFPLFEAVQRLCERRDVDRKRVRLRMIGHCHLWKGIDVAAWIASRGLEDVIVLEGAVSQAQVRAATAASNLLVNLAQGQRRQIPAKSYEYIAAGRRVLVVAERDSDVAVLFAEAGVGDVVEPGSPVELDHALECAWYAMSGMAASVCAEVPDLHRFSREARSESFERAVLEALGRGPSRV